MQTYSIFYLFIIAALRYLISSSLALIYKLFVLIAIIAIRGNLISRTTYLILTRFLSLFL
jgi:hypothetical protein